MLSFIAKRLALAVPTFIAVSALVFIVARLAPSSPVDIIAGEKATPQVKAQIAHQYGLDRPLVVQYVDYLWHIVRYGDFGRSFSRNQQPVREMIATDFPVTAQLAIAALLFALCVGLPMGALAALYHNGWFDRFAMSVVVALVSIPSIVLGPLMVMAFALALGWLPVSGWQTTTYRIGSRIHFDISLVDPRFLIMPMIALGSRSAALIARFMRSSLLDVLKQDYIRTAIAKGLTRGQAVWRHALKNAFLPVLTVIGTSFGTLLTGSFVVETIFGVPGIGKESVDSITRRDYAVIQGMAILVALIFILVNLLVDVLYGVIDPRVRSQGRKAAA